MKQLSPSANWAWLLIQLAFIGAVFGTGWYWPGNSESPLSHRSLGLFLMLFSALIGLVGCLTLRSSLSAFPQPKERRLVTRGLYRWMRHPMYAGLLVLALGWVFLTGSFPALIASAALWWFLKRKAALEDKMLARIYPEHASYAESTWCFFSGRSCVLRDPPKK
jgi:protein-S-isoprenylcysteine O-methyltransferase Ste14